MTRMLLRTGTVVAATAYMLVTVGLVTVGGASAERSAESPARVQGPPTVQLPAAALDTSVAPLHSPVLTVPDGRKFR